MPTLFAHYHPRSCGGKEQKRTHRLKELKIKCETFMNTFENQL